MESLNEWCLLHECVEPWKQQKQTESDGEERTRAWTFETHEGECQGWPDTFAWTEKEVKDDHWHFEGRSCMKPACKSGRTRVTSDAYNMDRVNRNSILAKVARCTSSGPSAIRRVRAAAHKLGKIVS